jgi:release factor glutamine methyltransferase
VTDGHDLAGTVTWGELLAEAEGRLERAGLDSARIDARRIVEAASGFEGARFVLARDEPVTERAMAAFDSMVARREAGEPLQYVIGSWGFRNLDLAVDRRALIPRPETEMLVEVALAHVDRIVADPDRGPVTVVDLGTGSGAIALSIAGERASTAVWATDRSPDALALARANLAGLGRAATRVRVAEGEWFAALPGELAGSVDVVVSNPPYVTDDDPLPAEVERWEPVEALRAGPDGLDDLRVIVAGAPAWLRPGGALVVELDPRQAAPVAALMQDAGFVDVVVTPDLTGRDRIVSGLLAP